jgi:hypothetical protein
VKEETMPIIGIAELREILADSRLSPELQTLLSNGEAKARGAVSTSWSPIDLRPLLAGEHDELEEAPSMLARGDGPALLYAGKVHSFAGEPESGKTWLALYACGDTIQHTTERVLYLDCEDSARGVIARLRALGVDDDAIAERFDYIRPEEPLTKPGRADLDAALGDRPALVVLDGVTEAMVMHDLDPSNNRDVAAFMEQLPRPLARSGAAVVLIDHVVKAKDGRGRYAIGAQHKLAGLDGAAYSFEAIRPFGRGREGVARIEVTKDRPGFVRQIAEAGTRVAELYLRSREDGRVELEVRPVSRETQDVSLAADRILALLQTDAAPLTVMQLQEASAHDGNGRPLKRSTVQRALEELCALGMADADKPGNGLPNRWWRTEP